MDEPGTQTIEDAEAGRQWGELLDKLLRKETRIIVERGGRPVASIVSFDDFQQLTQGRQERFRLLARMRAAFADRSEADIERDVAELVEQVRVETRRERAATERA